MLLIGTISNYFSVAENNSFIEFIFSNIPKNISEEELEGIFSRLGYYYENGSVSW